MTTSGNHVSIEDSPEAVPSASSTRTYICAFCSNADRSCDMVSCIKWKWFHYDCVNVTSDIKNQPWSCSSCLLEDSIAPVNASTKMTPYEGSTKSKASSVRRRRKQLELQRLEEERELQKQYLKEKYEVLQQFATDDSDDDDDSCELISLQQQRAEKWVSKVATVPQSIQQQSFTENRERLDPGQSTASQAPQIAQPSQYQHQQCADVNVNTASQRNVNSFSNAELYTGQVLITPTTYSTTMPNRPHVSPVNVSPVNIVYTNTLTSSQVAARQVVAKELPIFSGRPEEWPLFYSSFCNTTAMCGYSNMENLSRLQRCLKGKALEAVSCRLLLPDTVPDVIATLKMMFGRPEVIINSLLEKIRSAPSPKAEKFDSLITYALSIRNLCATMQAVELTSHMNNPMLLQEFVARLPSQIRFNWAIYLQNTNSADLLTFSDWLSAVAEAICKVTLPNSSSGPSSELRTEGRAKSNAFIHAHTQNESGSRSQSTPTCVVCSSAHPLHTCELFLNMPQPERWNVVKTQRLCRCCLKRHNFVRCRQIKQCNKEGCTAKHHQLLHRSIAVNNAVVASNHHYQRSQHVFFRIAPVTLHGSNNRTVDTFAFLDEGSSITLIEEDIANELQLEGIRQDLCLQWTSNTVRVETNSKIVNLQISKKEKGSRKFHIFNAKTVESLNLPTQTVSASELAASYPHLKAVPLQSYQNCVPRILIGADNWKLSTPMEVIEGSWRQPVAMKSRIGWTILGPRRAINAESQNEIERSYHMCECTKSEELKDMVAEFFSIENLGVQRTSFSNIGDDRALMQLKSKNFRCGTHFTTGLLWKQEDVYLPDSYSMARRRLECLEKQMSRDATLKVNVHKQITNLLSKGYARKLTPEEFSIKSPKTWYLPIFIVKNPNKPDKIRLVWDAAAKCCGTSLNSALLKGPDLLTALPSVLYGFRLKRVALCGDISEMYHQVHINEDDQHSQRFLWRTDPCADPEVYVMTVMTFGASCSPSAAQYIKNLNTEDFTSTFPEACRAITHHHYVDDLLISVNSEAEAVQLARDIKYVHSKGGFNMRNWLSNSEEVQAALGETHHIKSCVPITTSPDKIHHEKVLGMWWNRTSDCFTYSLKFNKVNRDVLAGNKRPSKREVLRTLMSIFDPLGFLSSFLVFVKVLLRDVWRAKLEWDAPLSDEFYERWLQWVHILPLIENVHIRRCYSDHLTDEHAEVQLHIMVDASESAYAAVAFFRIKFEGRIECSLVGAKSKVAPQMPIMSIPRLELQAALLGARLAESICRDHPLNITKKVYWSDSKTVLSWLHSDPRSFKQFVMFRVSEILDLTNVRDWRWIPSRLNVADEATKWTKIPDLAADSRWFAGPSFLYLNEDNWPQDDMQPCSAVPGELRNPQICHYHVEVTELIKFDRFSKWERLLRTVAYMLRFVQNLKAKTSKKGPFSSEELAASQNLLYRIAQENIYSDELKILDSTTDDSLPTTSPIYKYSPYLDSNQILRVRGRIDKADVDESVKRPILLPRRHRVTELIVNFYHHKFHHGNNESVLNEIRQQIEIPQMRSLLKKVQNECMFCRVRRATPSSPEMSPLPASRLAAFTRPFSYVGVDYFGPLLVTVCRRKEKRWGVLFTCLTVRAIHLEVAHSLTTDSCIMCIRNFISTRGMPLEFYSDNGTNFRGCAEELKKELRKINLCEVSNAFTTAGTKWNFIPPAAPHMGGSWERLVGSVKRTLSYMQPTVGCHSIRDETLWNLFKEVQNIINSRPLTYVALECGTDEALTPNHFLFGSSNGHKLPGVFCDEDLILRKNWRKSQQLADIFWRRWLKEYLPTLVKRTKWFKKSGRSIKVGDIVVVVDDQLPRNSWPKGIIEEIVRSPDGEVRSATVRTATGLFKRPVVKLAVLEVNRASDNEGKPSAPEQLTGWENVGNAAKRATEQ